MRDPQAKILTLAQAVEWRAALRRAHADLVVTNGVFDLLHFGHAELLYRASRHGDRLLVLLNSDASTSALKGVGRPLQAQADRAYVLASLAAVHAVVLFEGARCAEELRQLAPDAYVKAGYTLATLDADERAALEAAGARIEFEALQEGRSTSALIARCRALPGADAEASA